MLCSNWVETESSSSSFFGVEEISEEDETLLTMLHTDLTQAEVK